MSRNPFQRRSGITPGAYEAFTPADGEPPVDVSIVGNSPLSTTEWVVRMEGLPADMPTDTRVSFRDERLDSYKTDAGFVDLAMTRASLPQVTVFVGQKLPSFKIDISPSEPRPGLEHRFQTLGAGDFVLGADGKMLATVPWDGMTIERVIAIPDPREVVPLPSEKGNGKVVLVVAAGAAVLAGWYYWKNQPRRNPSCCASCARGGACRGKKRRR